MIIYHSLWRNLSYSRCNRQPCSKHSPKPTSPSLTSFSRENTLIYSLERATSSTEFSENALSWMLIELILCFTLFWWIEQSFIIGNYHCWCSCLPIDSMNMLAMVCSLTRYKYPRWSWQRIHLPFWIFRPVWYEILWPLLIV